MARAINMELGADVAQVSRRRRGRRSGARRVSGDAARADRAARAAAGRARRVARVVINERTGTVVLGGDVRLGPAAVAHGNLSVRIATQYDVSQPAPFSAGQTTVDAADASGG